jgi:hypothetical protein
MIRPFDLILFRGADFISDSIRKLQKIASTKGEFSHVGIVVNTDILPNIKNAVPGKWYIWESTMSGKLNDGINDVETGEAFFGTQIRSLDEIIEKYSKNPKTKISFAQLSNNPILKKQNESEELYQYRLSILKRNIQDVYNQYNHRRYDANLINLLSTILPFCRWLRNCRRNESFFCSELVAIIYKKIDILPWYINEEDITPETFIQPKISVNSILVSKGNVECFKNTYLDAIVQPSLLYCKYS